MKTSTLILKSFGEYETHVTSPRGSVLSTFRKRVVLGRFDILGLDLHVPYPTFDYPGNMLATPLIEPSGDTLVMKFDQWRLFDILMNRYLPIRLLLTHPGSDEVVDLVDRYVRHARELDDDQLAEWAPIAAAQLGVGCDVFNS